MGFRTAIVAVLAACAIDAAAQGYPAPRPDCSNAATARQQQACRSPARPAAAPSSAFPATTLDDLPPDAEDDDEPEEFGWTDYAIAFGIAALLAALAMFIVGRRERPSEGGARDASGGPT